MARTARGVAHPFRCFAVAIIAATVAASFAETVLFQEVFCSAVDMDVFVQTALMDGLVCCRHVD